MTRFPNLSVDIGRPRRCLPGKHPQVVPTSQRDAWGRMPLAGNLWKLVSMTLLACARIVTWSPSHQDIVVGCRERLLYGVTFTVSRWSSPSPGPQVTSKESQ
jgi:hypothetical protein